MYTACRPTVLGLQRLAHGWTRLLGARLLPGAVVPWSPPWPPEVGAELWDQWRAALGPFDHFAVYQRRQSERAGLTLLLASQGKAHSVVKVRTEADDIAREQRALGRAWKYGPTTFAVPEPLGAGTGPAGFHWTAQRAVFDRPHRPESDPHPDMFAEIVEALGGKEEERDGQVPAHNDLTPWNVRRDVRGRTWIFDWEDTGHSPPGADRAYFCASAWAVLGQPMPHDLDPGAVRHVREWLTQRVETSRADQRVTDSQISALSSVVDAPTVLVANPSLDVYGADLQMALSVRALRERGSRVVVLSPSEGPLRAALTATGAEVEVLDYPVLRRAEATSLRGLARLAVQATRSLPRMAGALRHHDPDIVYVNTLTLPWWLATARLSRRRSLCHVHEAERALSPTVRRVLTVPLWLADTVVANSRSTWETAVEAMPSLAASARLVRNGVAPPDRAVARPIRTDPTALAVIGRLSERKGVLTALEAVALLRSRGRQITLEVCGTAFATNRAYRDLLMARAARPDLLGAVSFSGYVAPIWPVLERSDILLAPSQGESFGNAVVESQLALRPVVATDVNGHVETVVDEVTGLLVPVDDAVAFADAVERLIDHPELAARLVDTARSRAESEFGLERYGDEIVRAVADLAGR